MADQEPLQEATRVLLRAIIRRAALDCTYGKCKPHDAYTARKFFADLGINNTAFIKDLADRKMSDE